MDSKRRDDHRALTMICAACGVGVGGAAAAVAAAMAAGNIPCVLLGGGGKKTLKASAKRRRVFMSDIYTSLVVLLGLRRTTHTEWNTMRSLRRYLQLCSMASPGMV